VLIDDKIVKTYSLSGDIYYERKLPYITSQGGSYIQFDLTGIGQVSEIEYKVKYRQNGK